MHACEHNHNHAHGLKGSSLEGALDRAERRVEAAGERLTPIRRRALDFLMKRGLVHKIERLNAFMACGHAEGDEAHTAAFLVCDCCGDAREIEPPPSAAVEAAAKASGYALTGVTLEAHGLCPDCAAQ